MGIPPEDLHALAQLPGRVPCPEEVVGRRPGRAGAASLERNVHRGRGVRRGLTPRAPARWRGSSPTRRVQRPRCAVAVGGVRGGTAPRQPLPGTREAWPQRVGWLSRRSGQTRPPTVGTLGRRNLHTRILRRLLHAVSTTGKEAMSQAFQLSARVRPGSAGQRLSPPVEPLSANTCETRKEKEIRVG